MQPTYSTAMCILGHSPLLASRPSVLRDPLFWHPVVSNEAAYGLSLLRPPWLPLLLRKISGKFETITWWVIQTAWWRGAQAEGARTAQIFILDRRRTGWRRRPTFNLPPNLPSGGKVCTVQDNDFLPFGLMGTVQLDNSFYFHVLVQ